MRQPNKAQKTKKVDSKEKVDCHATASAVSRNDRKNAPSKKVDSSSTATPSSRALRKQSVAIHKQQKQKGENADSASAESMDCHADFQSARNDRKKAAFSKVDSRKATNVSEQPKDSRSNKTAKSHNSTNATRRQDLGDRIVALQGVSRAHTRAYVTAESPQQSAILAPKPTPETHKAQSPSQAQPTIDILTCLANLSSDEVFTPPKLVNAMLDLLPQELFSDPSATFLDPASKSGVFLREIARRLMLGLESAIPDPRKRVAHILSRQLFGIATTEMTSILSRRTLYGSKDTDNPTYSIPYKVGAALPQGSNLYYDKHTPHSFKKGKCTYCGASQSQYDRDSSLESYAYAFIHELEPLEEFFTRAKVDSSDTATTHNDSDTNTQGVPMSFSVIIGNPPYQLSDGAGGGGSSAIPLYNKFIDRARELNPKHIVMIVPARWYSGGKGLDDFRASMLNDSRLVEIHDFPNASDCFPDNAIEGGVCYFRWDSAKEDSQRLLSDRGGAA